MLSLVGKDLINAILITEGLLQTPRGTQRHRYLRATIQLCPKV